MRRPGGARPAERKLRIYQQTLDAITAAEAATMQKAARFLERRMGTDIARITGGRYDRVRVDENDLAITVWSPEREAWVDATQLSKGTADQLYLAARLGLVRQVTQERRPPLIFDDPFVTFDDERALRAMAVLKELAADHQVLYLTCSDRYDAAADLGRGAAGPGHRPRPSPAPCVPEPPAREEPFALTLSLDVARAGRVTTATARPPPARPHEPGRPGLRAAVRGVLGLGRLLRWAGQPRRWAATRRSCSPSCSASLLALVPRAVRGGGGPHADRPRSGRRWPGCSGLAGVGCLYLALSGGTMGIVAPATGLIAAAIPAAIGIATGDPVGPLLLAGMAVALAAVVIISLPDGTPGPLRGAPPRRSRAREWVLILGAGCGFAGFYVLADVAHEAGSGTVWTLVGVRAGVHPRRARLPAGAAAGRPRRWVLGAATRRGADVPDRHRRYRR